MNTISDLSSLSIMNAEIMISDLGTVYGDDPNRTTTAPKKYVLGLRFDHTNAQNISVWLDGKLGDILFDINKPLIQQDLLARGYDIRALVLTDNSVLPVFNSNPSNWPTMPNLTDNNPPLDVGSASMDAFGIALSKPIAIAVIPPSTSTDSISYNLQNFRLKCSFDTAA